MTPANDGASHQAIEDMGVLRTIPNMTVVMPADYNSAKKLTKAAAETYGPMYLRFTRDAVPQIYDENVEFVIGKAHQIQDGKDVAIIANGDTVRLAVEAAKVLEEKGISARVLDMHTIKPLDVEAVTACVNDIGKNHYSRRPQYSQRTWFCSLRSSSRTWKRYCKTYRYPGSVRTVSSV